MTGSSALSASGRGGSGEPTAASHLTVAITGASGFIGKEVARDLIRAGHRVRAISRRVTDAEGPTPLLVDYSSVDTLALAFEGCETVVHLAARVHDTSGLVTKEEYRDQNVLLSATVARACSDAGVRRLVFISSVKAVAENTLRVDRDFEPSSPDDAYGTSKREAESVVSNIGRSSGVDAVTLRFPLVYGPGMRANMRALADAVGRGERIPVPRPPNRRSILFVGNAVAAIRAVIEHPAPASGVYFVADDRPVSTEEMVTGLAAGLGVAPRTITLPAPLAVLVIRTSGLLGRRGRRLSARLARVLGSLVVDPRNFNATFGFVPPYASAEGLRLTAESLRAKPG